MVIIMLKLSDIMSRIEAERKALGLSVWALCAASRVHENSYRSYLDGTGNPTIKTLNRIEEALKQAEADRRSQQ